MNDDVAPNPAGELTAPFRVHTPVKHTSLHNRAASCLTPALITRVNHHHQHHYHHPHVFFKEKQFDKRSYTRYGLALPNYAEI